MDSGWNRFLRTLERPLVPWARVLLALAVIRWR